MENLLNHYKTDRDYHLKDYRLRLNRYHAYVNYPRTEYNATYYLTKKDLLEDVVACRQKAIKASRIYNAFKTLLKNASTLEETKLINKYDLTIYNDFDVANEILSSGEHTSDYVTNYIYNNRIFNNFIGTYKIDIKRTSDYLDFIKAIVADATEHNTVVDFTLDYDEWQEGKKQDGKRQIRLNKFLRKKGFSQYVLDYYSQQIKTDRTVYLTISDRVQHIAGMSYYSSMDWNGVSGSSCMDPRNNYEESKRLLPTLHDNKLLVVFLHDRLEDLEDMTGKMLARTVGRIVHVDGKQYLITTRLYGNNETKDMLDKAIEAINPYGIFTRDQMIGNGRYVHKEQTNGTFFLYEYDEVVVNEYVDQYVEVTCPACEGEGEMEVETSTFMETVEITCPVCQGSGTYEAYVSVDVEYSDYVEVPIPLYPYDEGYDHLGDFIQIFIDKDVLKRAYKG